MKENWIVIPALEPRPEFPDDLVRLRQQVPAQILVIDDGSGPSFRPLFARIAALEGCTVLYHSANRGKGRALKTGFSYLEQRRDRVLRVVCADCDGQHAAGDVAGVLGALDGHPGALALGQRNFSAADTPLRSRLGNRAATVLFWLASGRWLPDTQTGLRAFDGALLPLLCRTPGERFDYEMRVLLVCARRDIPILLHPIATIYWEGNRGSHFRPLRDSLGVLGTLFADLIRFGLSSLFCAGLDLFVFWMLVRLIPVGGSLEGFARIAAATTAARTLSATANYWINRNCVFRITHKERALKRYFLLCAGIAVLSAVGVTLLSQLPGLRPTGAKVLCDAVLFLASYRLQRDWVFGRKEADHDF